MLDLEDWPRKIFREHFSLVQCCVRQAEFWSYVAGDIFGLDVIAEDPEKWQTESSREDFFLVVFLSRLTRAQGACCVAARTLRAITLPSKTTSKNNPRNTASQPESDALTKSAYNILYGSFHAHKGKKDVYSPSASP